MLQHFRHKLLHISAGKHHFFHQRHSLFRIFLGQGFGHFEENGLVYRAHNIQHLFQCHFLAAEKGKALVQDTQGISHGAIPQLGHIADSFGRCSVPFLGKIFRKGFRDGLRRDSSKIKPLYTGQNRRGDFLGVCGRQNEDNMCRGLFQCFQQCVKGTIGKHMHFVDDIDFKPSLGRGIFYFFADFADIIYAIVGSGIDLNDIDASARQDILTNGTLVTGFAVFRGVGAVDSSGEDFRCRGLTGTPCAAEQVGVGNTLCFHLVFQRSDDMVLPDDAIEGLGAEFSIQCRISHKNTPSPGTLSRTLPGNHSLDPIHSSNDTVA